MYTQLKNFFQYIASAVKFIPVGMEKPVVHQSFMVDSEKYSPYLAHYPMTANETAYLQLLEEIITFGVEKKDRTGKGTISLHGQSITYDLKDTFPRFTTKFVAMKTAIAEMMCFLAGSTNLKDFHALNCHVWDEFADDSGDLGPIYGKQWRQWKRSVGTEIDQITEVLKLLAKSPYSRRLIVSAWNPEFLSNEDLRPKENPSLGLMSLSPCHKDFQLLTRPMQGLYDIGRNNIHYLPEHFRDDEVLEQAVAQGIAPMFLDMVLSIRSNDMFLGHPFNAVQYAFLLSWISHCYSMIPGRLTIHIGDAHIYSDHVSQVDLQLSRDPYDAIEVYFDPSTRCPENFFKMNNSDFLSTQYKHHSAIHADLAVG